MVWDPHDIGDALRMALRVLRQNDDAPEVLVGYALALVSQVRDVPEHLRERWAALPRHAEPVTEPGAVAMELVTLWRLADPEGAARLDAWREEREFLAWARGAEEARG